MPNRPLVVVAALAVTGIGVLGQSKPSIQGVWRVAEVTTSGPSAATNNSPQPSLWIFTGKHYSLMRVTSDSPRPLVPFRAGGDVTEAQMNETFREWQPFQAHAGTYDIAGSTLRLRPVVAKSTSVMANTKGQVWEIKTDGDALRLAQTTGPTGEKLASPVMFRLVRLE